MAKKTNRNVSIQKVVDTFPPFIPRMSAYAGICTPNRKNYIKRRAKFAPDLLAEGLTTGIVSSANTLLHGYFDDDGVTKVDRLVDIHADKFDNMNVELQPPGADPSSITPTGDPQPNN